MKRTKMKRTKQKTSSIKKIWPMGGHILNPPEDCPRPVIFYRKYDNTHWVDAVLCKVYCGTAYCDEAQAQFDKHKEDRKKACEKALLKEQKVKK